MKILNALIVLIFILNTHSILGQCGTTFLDSQTEIDNFVSTSNCTEIQGSLYIEGANDLSGLSQITSITGELSITLSFQLQNLQGLENLTYIGGELEISSTKIKNLQELANLSSLGNLKLGFNQELLNLEGLEQIQTVNRLTIDDCNSLKSVDGLDALTSVGSNLFLINNDSIEDITALQNLISIGINFSIADGMLYDLSGLENLTSVGGDFSLAVPTLNNINQLSNLNQIEGLTVRFCESLISLDGLENITALNPEIRIEKNNVLTSISALSNITSAEDIFINENDALINLEGLENIQTVDDRLRIWYNPSLNGINLNSLSSVGGIFSILDCPNLPSLDGLENLESIGGELTLIKITALTNIEALGQLEFVGESITLGDLILTNGLPSLQSLKGLENITHVNGNLIIDNCISLTDLEGLQNLNSIDNDFFIRSNTALTSLYGLQGLNSIGGELSIGGNFNLDNIGEIKNADLSDLNLLRIYGNPKLSVCSEVSICNYLNNGGSNSISNNDSGCDNSTEVLNNCSLNNAKVQTNAFYDFNQNQQQDPGEFFLPDVQFFLTPLDISFFSNQNDGVITYLNNGSYTLQYNNNINQNWNLVTDSTSFSFSINNTFDSEILSFGFYPSQDISDMLAFFNGPPARCGEVKTFSVQTKNMGTTITSGTMWVEMDPLFSNPTFTMIPDTTIGTNTYGWFFGNLYPGHTFSQDIQLQIPAPPVVNIGDELHFEVFTEYQDMSGEYTSEVFEYDTPIFCSFDPNDKLVHPTRNNNLTLFDEDLIYTIRFQNTGNDVAYDIIIRDTLDENLNPSTFRVLSTSHPDVLTTTLDENGYLAFNFEDIYLPDSSSYFDDSQGYVSYSISPKEGLPEETNITNTASIYFDFNPAIVTNTTENILVSMLPTSIQSIENPLKFKIYPNPVSDFIFIKKENLEALTYQVSDINGRVILEERLQNEIEKINLSKIGKGIYFIKILDGNSNHFFIDKFVKY